MAYTYKNKAGKTYTLHGRTTMLKSGKERTLYFFSSKEGEGAMSALPKGYVVSETRNGLPVLKRAG